MNRIQSPTPFSLISQLVQPPVDLNITRTQPRITIIASSSVQPVFHKLTISTLPNQINFPCMKLQQQSLLVIFRCKMYGKQWNSKLCDIHGLRAKMSFELYLSFRIPSGLSYIIALVWLFRFPGQSSRRRIG